MNLVNELENDLALAFFVDKLHSETLDSKGVVALMNRVREILEPESAEDEMDDNILVAGIASDTSNH
jgi:ribosome biogenesis SPOUT family RNA methylase Rps3